jgi:hypothetical protein
VAGRAVRSQARRFPSLPPSVSLRMVGGGGFEPPKASPTDLQSVPFDRSGTPPALRSPSTAQEAHTASDTSLVSRAIRAPGYDARSRLRAEIERLELAAGIEPATRSLQGSRSTVELRQPKLGIQAAMQTIKFTMFGPIVNPLVLDHPSPAVPGGNGAHTLPQIAFVAPSYSFRSASATALTRSGSTFPAVFAHVATMAPRTIGKTLTIASAVTPLPTSTGRP